MPVLSIFFGIIIRMYSMDDKEHHDPHIHAEYAGERALLRISDGEVLRGRLPPSKLLMVRDWIIIHRKELRANWKLAVNGKEVFKIKGVLTTPYVQRVKADNRYRLKLIFDNGEKRIFDISPYLNKGVFTRLKKPEVFKMARVVAGSVEWPGGIDLSYDTLYSESKPITSYPI
jgi:hypothetical protein